MASCSNQKWEDLNLSRDEISSIGQALKKEEFRTLLAEYVNEINDPDNRRQYEEEITQLENERGVDVKFIHPISGYVIKTSINGKRKAFINVCSNTNVGLPISTLGHEGNNAGVNWSIPYCLAPPREDFDKKKNVCTVYDVVFHPDTLELTTKNGNLKKLVNDTSIGAVESNFNVSLDKINLKFPKMQYKGFKHATVIRKKLETFNNTTESQEIPNYPYPPLKEDNANYSNPLENNNNLISKPLETSDSNYATPTYKIKHISTIEMENFTNDPMCKLSTTVPKELVISIDLPLLKQTSDTSLDVLEKSLSLISEKPAKYKLDLNLPYAVDSNKGTAKFDLSQKVLVVTLPVKNKVSYKLINTDGREDSGIESDSNGCVRSNNVSSNDEDDAEQLIQTPNHTQMNTNLSRDNVEDSDLNPVNLLKSDLHYILPSFKCNFVDNSLDFTLQVLNVTPESLKHEILNECSGFQLSFSSIGTGFFPVHYAMYCKLPLPNVLKKDEFNLDVCDSHVSIHVKINQAPGILLTKFLLGTNQDNVKTFLLSTTNEINGNTKVSEIIESDPCEIDKVVEKGNHVKETGCINSLQKEFENVIPKKECSVLKCQADDADQPKSRSDDEVAGTSVSYESPERQLVKSRTLSETKETDVKGSKRKGILKIVRSLSESSVDEYGSWQSEKPKKSVRFSDIISKQVFRLNSSILGQRKKNQRKTKSKKRAQERRLSESGNESEGDVDFSESKRKSNECVWLNEPDSSSCDISEVSDISDISESDDGLKDSGPPSLPCSSKKNHKRRGKKSARKNAATAKLNHGHY